MTEFTGERVIPGQVDDDLWNEHFARYAFARRLAKRKRVLDAGCGSGYGSAELARSAAFVLAADISSEAVAHARGHFILPNLQFLQASCTQLPLADASLDLVTAFEVIEHLTDWRSFLAECGRLLAPGGQLVVSTPNKDYYEDSRGPEGANPYHEHEFGFEEFAQELRSVFPHVSLFLQNHAEAFVFRPAGVFSPAEARVEDTADTPEHAHFFLAVCALSPQTGAPTFLYLPKTANILREREQHIAKLRGEIDLKDRKIAELGDERLNLTQMFRAQKEQLEESNRWAGQLNQKLEDAASTINTLHQELEDQSKGYQAKISELEQDNRAKAEWAVETERRLTRELADKCAELAQCVEALHKVEGTLEERTEWARSLDRQVEDLKASLGLVRASRWVKLGSALGVGPRLRNS